MAAPGADGPARQLVIVGGGWAGSSLLRELCRPDARAGARARAAGRSADVGASINAGDFDRVVVLSCDEHFVFTPLLPRSAAGALPLTSTRTRLDRMSPFAEVRHGRVTGIDRRRRTVTYEPLGGHVAGEQAPGPVSLPYAALVLCPGSRPATFGTPGVAEHAVPLRTTEDAARVRRGLVRAFDRAQACLAPPAGEPLPGAARADRRARDRAAAMLAFVVVGAGPTGVEMATEIQAFVARYAGPTFGRELADMARVHLVDPGTCVLGNATLGPALRQRVLELLRDPDRSPNIRLHLGSRVVRVLGPGEADSGPGPGGCSGPPPASGAGDGDRPGARADQAIRVVLRPASARDAIAAGAEQAAERHLACGLLIWAAGNQPAELVHSLDRCFRREPRTGRLLVDGFLRAVMEPGDAEGDSMAPAVDASGEVMAGGHTVDRGIFVAGDSAAPLDPAAGPWPMSAQLAKHHGVYLGQVFSSYARRPGPFRYVHRGFLCGLGTRRGPCQEAVVDFVTVPGSVVAGGDAGSGAMASPPAVPGPHPPADMASGGSLPAEMAPSGACPAAAARPPTGRLPIGMLAGRLAAWVWCLAYPAMAAGFNLGFGLRVAVDLLRGMVGKSHDMDR